ncbi:MAG: LysR family transcriptional regulator substrate-binding protein, partial [Pseudomonadota bacterium]
PDWAQATPLAAAPVRIAGPSDDEKNRPLDLTAANARGWALNLEGCGFRAALFAALEQVGATPNILLETNALELQLALVASGRAFTLLPATGISAVADRGVAARRGAGFSLTAEAMLLTHKTGAPSAALTDAVAAPLVSALNMTF